MESLAILERGYLYRSPASAEGVKSECPYCVARHITEYRPSDLAVMLQASEAGRLLSYKSSQADDQVDQFEWTDEVGQWRLMREHWLTLPLDVLTVPFWLPKLSLRNCFIIDELVVWFCNESAAGRKFHWDDDKVIEVVRTCWRKRLPIEPSELSKVMLAHGMPEIYQERAEKLFAFGMRVLIGSEGRRPLKKLRAEGTAGERLYAIWTEYRTEIDRQRASRQSAEQ
jgi:hypothetical protein